MAAKTTYVLWDNETLESGVTITSSAEATGRPDDNVANRARWKIWRSSTTTGDQWIKFDLGSNQTLKAIFLVNWIAHTGGAISVQAHATDSWGSPTVDEVVTLPSFNPTEVVGAVFSSQSLRWVRVYYTNTASANEYVELGLCFAGDYLEPTRTIFHEFPLRRIDPSSTIRALDGQEETQERPMFHQFSGEFRLLPEADKDLFMTAFDTIGARKSFFFVLDTTDPDLQFYGKFDSALALDHATVATGEAWTIPFSFRESL